MDPLAKWLLGSNLGIALVAFFGRYLFSSSTAKVDATAAKVQLHETQLATGAESFKHLRENLHRCEDKVAKLEERLNRIDQRRCPVGARGGEGEG